MKNLVKSSNWKERVAPVLPIALVLLCVAGIVTEILCFEMKLRREWYTMGTNNAACHEELLSVAQAHIAALSDLNKKEKGIEATITTSNSIYSTEEIAVGGLPEKEYQLLTRNEVTNTWICLTDKWTNGETAIYLRGVSLRDLSQKIRQYIQLHPEPGDTMLNDGVYRSAEEGLRQAAAQMECVKKLREDILQMLNKLDGR